MINISGYKFAPLGERADLEALREWFLPICNELGLKGTILLANEGSNYGLAGTREAIDKFKEILDADPRFAGIEFKESLSDSQPFQKMRVKLRKEAVTMGVEGIDPGKYTGPHISAEEFKKMLDDNQDITVLDTRNTFEVAFGTFAKAEHLGIKDFRQFPEALDQYCEAHPEIKDKPVVIFCTGGIRCEKASPLMIEKGFKEVYQLDGGIIKYFEHCQDNHYQGECFVFDERIALDANLQVTDTGQCQDCQMPIHQGEAHQCQAQQQSA